MKDPNCKFFDSDKITKQVFGTNESSSELRIYCYDRGYIHISQSDRIRITPEGISLLKDKKKRIFVFIVKTIGFIGIVMSAIAGLKQLFSY